MNMTNIDRARASLNRVSTSTTIALWMCLITTIALFIMSAYWPPKGAIDPSMFKAAGYIFAFATLMVVREGVREGLGVSFTHGDTTVTIRDQDGPDTGPDVNINTNTK